jgi:hypothetical protein
MPEESRGAKGNAGVRELHVAIQDVSFDEIVEILRKVWVVAKIPGIRGCDPCRSGLDRFVIEDPAFRQFMR